MRPPIDRTGHDFESEALVVRTDYSDDEAWRVVVDLLGRPPSGVVHGGREAYHFVDDRAFAGASPDEVVQSTIAGDPDLEVVFVADAVTMEGDHLLLAVSTKSQERDDDEEELSPEFRVVPTDVVAGIHVNLAIGHMDFWEFAYNAARDPEHIYRW